MCITSIVENEGQMLIYPSQNALVSCGKAVQNHVIRWITQNFGKATQIVMFLQL